MENGEQKPPFYFCCASEIAQNELLEVESGAEEENGTTCTLRRPAGDSFKSPRSSVLTAFLLYLVASFWIHTSAK